jgi:hypothetical protein
VQNSVRSVYGVLGAFKSTGCLRTLRQKQRSQQRSHVVSANAGRGFENAAGRRALGGASVFPHHQVIGIAA